MSGKPNKKYFFCFFPEPPPIFGEAKVVQGERKANKKYFFWFFPEPPPIFDEVKVVQGEGKTKFGFSE
ncbi:MAG: hypothetical protein IJM04_12085 [Prevotella sp.]|nr:hypothetical protein [Prevotella sp.]